MTLPDRPDWLHPLPADPPPLPEAMAALRSTCAGFAPPTHVCVQCYGEDVAARFIAAAREVSEGGAPQPEAFGQMYFEHPDCSGGIETVKLMFPRGVETMLLGTQPPGFHGYPEVLETALMAGIWFWPEPIRMALRQLAGRLFWDWFVRGHYGLDGWPKPGFEADTIGPGDDILSLCAAALIDPADVVSCLADIDSVWADDALTLCLANGFGSAPSYCAPDTGREEKRYLEATETVFGCIDARASSAALQVVTPAWLQAAFYRYEESHPALAAELSRLENFYQIQTVEAAKRAAGPLRLAWPALPAL